MNKFKVRIISCKVDTYWYKNMVGRVVEVTDGYNTYRLASDDRNCFDISDCIKLDEHRDKYIEALLNI